MVEDPLGLAQTKSTQPAVGVQLATAAPAAGAPGPRPPGEVCQPDQSTPDRSKGLKGQQGVGMAACGFMKHQGLGTGGRQSVSRSEPRCCHRPDGRQGLQQQANACEGEREKSAPAHHAMKAAPDKGRSGQTFGLNLTANSKSRGMQLATSNTQTAQTRHIHAIKSPAGQEPFTTTSTPRTCRRALAVGCDLGPYSISTLDPVGSCT